MTWCAIAIQTVPAAREKVARWLVEHTRQAVEERDDGALGTVAPDEAAAEMLIVAMRASLPETRLEVTLGTIEETDWTTRWRDGIIARRFGRLVLRPSWIDVPLGPDDVEVVVDPETAFGSGEHGSTRAALILLERHLVPGQAMLDLGSGSGVLAIAAVKLGARRAIGIEIDEESVAVSERNTMLNGTMDKTAFLLGDCGDLAPLSGPADLLCSNILRLVNTALLPEIRRALVPGGLAIFSGMEIAEAPFFREALVERGFVEVDQAEDAGWWAVAARPS